MKMFSKGGGVALNTRHGFISIAGNHFSKAIKGTRGKAAAAGLNITNDTFDVERKKNIPVAWYFFFYRQILLPVEILDQISLP